MPLLYNNVPMRFKGCSLLLPAKDLDEMGCEEVAKY